MRQDRIDLIHLISQSLIQHLQVEHISDLQLIEVREHLLTRHAGVGRQDTVGAFSANRQRASQ